MFTEDFVVIFVFVQDLLVQCQTVDSFAGRSGLRLCWVPKGIIYSISVKSLYNANCGAWVIAFSRLMLLRHRDAMLLTFTWRLSPLIPQRLHIEAESAEQRHWLYSQLKKTLDLELSSHQ